MLDWLFRRKPAEPPPRTNFLCSGCYSVHPETEMHALPWWNPGERAFFMSTRCGSCFPSSLSESRTRVQHWDPEAESAFRSFLEIWHLESHMPSLSRLTPRAAAEAVLDHAEVTAGREFAALFLGRR